MNKVLVICPQSPYPLHNGSAIRSFQSVRFLKSLGYHVDVLYLSTKSDLGDVNKGISAYCDNVYLFKRSFLLSLLRLFLCVFSHKPFQVSLFYSNKARQWIRRNIHEYTMVYCNNIRTAEYAKDAPCTKIIDFVDAISMNYEKSGLLLHGILRQLYLIESRRCLEYEKALLSIFDKKIIISDIDKNYILGDKNDVISVVPNAIVIGDKFIDWNTEEDNMVFVGSMYYEPNVQAVEYFTKKVLPIIWKNHPSAKFYIVGKKPDKRVAQLESDNVIVTGFVDSVWDYLKKASVVVVPMISGSGLQNKILEALAVKACVITTPIGFEGLEYGEGAPTVSKNATEMAKKISWLLENKTIRRELGEKGFEYVKRHYSEDVVLKKFKASITL